jgi:CHAT domain-containing protein
MAAMRIALAEVEYLRPHRGGGEQTRLEFMRRYVDYFDDLISWCLEAGDLEGAFEYSERARARLLLDQLAAGKVDLRGRIPQTVLGPLLERESQALARLAESQSRITYVRSRNDLDIKNRLARLRTLEADAGVWGERVQQVQDEIRNNSPLWRDTITSGGQPVSLSEVQRRLIPRGAFLLHYQLGYQSSHLFVIPPSPAPTSFATLMVEEPQAEILGVPAGPLTSAKLQQILAGTGDNASRGAPGLMKHLRAPFVGPGVRIADITRSLQSLFQVLLPASLWQRVSQAEEVILVVDGALHQIPFEALIVRSGASWEEAGFWLDEGPVVRYAASATSLYNITTRPRESPLLLEQRQSILTVSDAIYDTMEVAHEQALLGLSSPEPGNHPAPVALLTRDRYTRAGGPLSRLPGTARETAAILQAFDQTQPSPVQVLQRLDASEPKVRSALEGKRYVHIATHGILDRNRSELFAALAFTAPPGRTTQVEDDGFLQLFEIYGLNLSADLVVLSACESNIGPDVEGEGVFSLSRGFFAAGARRVVASLWPVADNSTAELMGLYFARIAERDRAALPAHYALDLRQAKRELRAKPQYGAPFFWAPFTLTGAR